MIRKSLHFAVVRRHIISENKISILILIVIGIFIYFGSLFNIHEFYEMEHRFICEEELAFNNPNV